MSRREAILIVLCVIFLSGMITMGYSLRTNDTKSKDPFTKVGSLATRNGLVAEVFKIDSCYILVTTVPNEASRGMFQMVCK